MKGRKKEGEKERKKEKRRKKERRVIQSMEHTYPPMEEGLFLTSQKH